MNLLLQIREAYANLLSAKLRSFLAVLGILVGTGSVVAMVSGGQLATQEALRQFSQLGTDLLSLSIYAESSSAASTAATPSLTVKNIHTLQQQVPAITSIAPYTSVYQDISFNGQSLQGSIIGATAALQNVISIDLLYGRFISLMDQYSSYCVIGNKLYEEIRQQGITNPINMQINLGDAIFTIVGVAEPWVENSFFNQDINEAIIIPIPSAAILSNDVKINNIVMRLADDADIDQVQQDITTFIDRVLPDQKLFFRSAKQLLQSMTNQRQTLTLLLALIGSISLLVGGIGVMNIMLVSVVERKREIGIRMAVGATRRDIQLLFLVESVALTLFGGLLGVLLGILTSFILAAFANWPFEIFLMPPLVGFLVSVAIGVFFGFYPAYQASRLDPIETLRSD